VIAAIVGGALLLVWPAFANGFPLVFIDTVSYLGHTLFPEWPWDKTPAYGPFLHALHWGVTPWPALLAQGLILSHLLWLAARVSGGVTPVRHLAACALLAAATSAPWFAATLMPDILAGVTVLCVALLGLTRARLARGEVAWLLVLGSFAAAAHLSHWLVALAVAGFVLLHERRAAPTLRALAPALLAAALLVTANAAVFGRATLSPHGSVFLLARLQADGLAVATLRARCPASGWYLCAFLDRLPMDSDEFLWDPASPVSRDAAGQPRAMGSVLLAPEASEIVRATLREQPLGFALSAARNGAVQLVTAGIGDTLGPEHLDLSARRAIARFPPGVLAAFDASRQARGELRALAAPFAAVIPAALTLCVPLLALGFARRPEARGMLLAICVGVSANALATGGLSKPHERYQARIAWLLPFAALLVWRYTPSTRRSVA
jgi:hypothetical protein